MTKHAVVVLAHDDVESLKHLVDEFDEDFDLYVHIDKQAKAMVREMRSYALCSRCGLSVYAWKHVRWGSIDIVKVQMRLIKIALSRGQYDYIHLMSGHDILLVNCIELKNFFSENLGKEYIEVAQLPKANWENGTFARFIRYGLYDWLDYNNARSRRLIEGFINIQRRLGFKRRIPDQYPKLYGGSNWMSLTSDCWRYLLTNYKRSFLRRLRFTFASDEVFFHTVLMNSPYGDKVSGRNLRLTCWNEGGAVKTLTGYDWWNICKSTDIIARKVKTRLSDTLVAWIDDAKNNSGRESERLDSVSELCPMERVDSDVAETLRLLTKRLDIKSACLMMCGNGIYVRYLRDLGVDAQGFDTYAGTPLLTSRLFPSGFYCQSAPLYEPIELDSEVDISIALTRWSCEDRDMEDIFLKNIARCTGKYALIRVGCSDHGHKEKISHIDEVMRAMRMLRNDAAGKLINGQDGRFEFVLYERSSATIGSEG